MFSFQLFVEETQRDSKLMKTIWSLNDQWPFASLIYDGRFIALNKVPGAEKYKICLWCFSQQTGIDDMNWLFLCGPSVEFAKQAPLS